MKWRNENEKLKRLMATVFVVTIIAAMAGTMPVSADEIVYGDLNSDGIIDMRDNISINKYLFGMYALYNCEVADLNCNGVVDAIDSEIMSAYITMSIHEIPYFGNIL